MMIENNTVTLKKYILQLVVCCIIVALLCIAHMLNSSIAVFLCLGIFVIFVLWSTLNESVIPILLFFMPWAPLLRTTPDSISFYTIALFLSGLFAFIRHHKRMRFNYIVAVVFIFMLTIVAKFLFGYSIDNSYIMFIIMLVLFPALLEAEGDYDFYTVIIFLSFGIITAALSAQRLAGNPSIAKFIDVYNWEQRKITRLSGYYRDPNFYSAHITVAISGVLLLITRENNKKRIPILAVLVIALLYCGFLSTSKSFVLILIVTLAIWLLDLLFMHGKITSKIAIFLSVILVATYILSSTVFADLIDIVIRRFNEGRDVSTLTTGRTDIWQLYLRVLKNNPLHLIFGQGFTNKNIAQQASHNTLLQMVYQFGLSGIGFIITWIVCYIKKAAKNVSLSGVSILSIGILALGCFGPWMGLDMLFFDEFFLVPFFFCFGLKWLTKQKESTGIIENKPERGSV